MNASLVTSSTLVLLPPVPHQGWQVMLLVEIRAGGYGWRPACLGCHLTNAFQHHPSLPTRRKDSAAAFEWATQLSRGKLISPWVCV